MHRANVNKWLIPYSMELDWYGIDWIKFSEIKMRLQAKKWMQNYREKYWMPCTQDKNKNMEIHLTSFDEERIAGDESIEWTVQCMRWKRGTKRQLHNHHLWYMNCARHYSIYAEYFLLYWRKEEERNPEPFWREIRAAVNFKEST